MNENVQNAKDYVKELFSGASKIVSFCKVYDCTQCNSATKLYKRVFSYHNSELVQAEFLEYADSLQNVKK